MNEGFYSLSAARADGSHFSFNNLEGKVVLIVNTATRCGLSPQFGDLEYLHQKYKNDGLVVIGFPCNQFLRQEPVSNEQMTEVCDEKYGVSFMLTEKIKVNGADTHPVFSYLKNELPGLWRKRIKWNFTKFLIDSKGNAVLRYSPKTKPQELESQIREMLNMTESHHGQSKLV